MIVDGLRIDAVCGITLTLSGRINDQSLRGGEGLQLFERGKFQCGRVGGFECNLRCHASIVSLFPTRRAEAPAVTGIEPGKPVFRSRRAEVVALSGGKFEELRGHDRANGMHSLIATPGVAVAISKESRAGFKTTRLQVAAQNISRHVGKMAQTPHGGNAQS